MNKTTIKQDLCRYNNGGGLITRAAVARYMGLKSQKNANRLLTGLTRVNGKYYFVDEVAERLMETSAVRR